MKTMEQKAQAYDEAVTKSIEFWTLCKKCGAKDTADFLESIFPELIESEDEKVRKELIDAIQGLWDNDALPLPLSVKRKDAWIAWLEKQEPIDRDKLAKGVLRSVANSIMQWLDANVVEGNMCLSNMECEDIENCVINADWSKVYRYMKKKLEKQGEDKQIMKGKSALEAAKEEKVDNQNCSIDTVMPKLKVKYGCGEYNVIEIKEINGVMYYVIEDEPNHIDYVKADACEIISGYGIKENGSPYPTKPAVFSEQKITDNIEPKFKVGDWIVNNGHSYLIAAIEDDRYLFEIGGYTHEQLNWEYIENADKKYHLWTIKDAKDGDVLVDVYGNISIYEECGDYDWTSYCSLGCNGVFLIFLVTHDNDKTHPATKEQRDTLFARMREAGYEWNDEKKFIFIREGGEE